MGTWRTSLVRGHEMVAQSPDFQALGVSGIAQTFGTTSVGCSCGAPSLECIAP
jgi:hypothetical protein